jgi:hypothetical protein
LLLKKNYEKLTLSDETLRGSYWLNNYATLVVSKYRLMLEPRVIMTTMLEEIEAGQEVVLGTREFKVITVVERDLVCLEPKEPPQGIWIMGYERVLKDARLLKSAQAV